MMEGKPIPAFLVTAITLWAIYLWKHSRLGKPGLLPHPEEVKPNPSSTPGTTGWRSGAPPVLPPVSPGTDWPSNWKR